jgi:hypothetical protein
MVYPVVSFFLVAAGVKKCPKAAGCRTLFTVVGFLGVRCIISNLKVFSGAFTRKRMITDTNDLRSI